MAEEPKLGWHHDALGTHAMARKENGHTVGVVLVERDIGSTSEPTMRDISEALIVVYGTDFGIHSPTCHAERHPLGARVLRNTMAQSALRRPDSHTRALADTVSEFLGMDEPRKRIAAEMSGLDVHYDFGPGHPLLGRRVPDLDLVTANGPLRVFTLLHKARPVLVNFSGLGGPAGPGQPGGLYITPWADRLQSVDAKYVVTWELPAIGAVTAPTAVLIRPDGYVAWVGDRTQLGLADTLTTWFGPPTAACTG